MDSFDPKPDAPAEYRGILAAIDTNLPGVQFSSHMKETAKIADKLTVVRSMTHTEVDHSRGEHSMFTGYRPSPALVYPSVGSVVAHELGPRDAMPPYVCVPTQGSQFLGSGYLSNACGPFALGTDPARPGFTVRDLSLPTGVDERRFESAQDLESSWSTSTSADCEQDDSLTTMDSFYQRAYDLLASPTAREAFSLKGETEATKELYGIQALGAGHSSLGRRAVPDRPAAGRSRVPVRDRHLRRLGHALVSLPRHRAADARSRQGVRRPDPRSRRPRACSTRRWWS